MSRRTIFPVPEDNWSTIAARELADVDPDEAIDQLQSWNMHVFRRPPAPGAPAGEPSPILPSDVIFVEPPAAP